MQITKRKYTQTHGKQGQRAQGIFIIPIITLCSNIMGNIIYIAHLPARYKPFQVRVRTMHTDSFILSV